jgi:hypothetical protein
MVHIREQGHAVTLSTRVRDRRREDSQTHGMFSAGLPRSLTFAATTTKTSGSPVVAVIVVLVVVGVFALYIGQSMNRKKGVARFASAQGWTYAARNDEVLQEFTGWPFNLGYHHMAKEVILGSIGDRPITAFRFEFSRTHLGGTLGLVQDVLTSGRGGGNAQGIFSGLDPTLSSGAGGANGIGFSERTWTLAAMRMPRRLPGVLVRFQLPVESLLPGAGSGDLELGDEDFDKYFLVRAEYPQVARELLTSANRSLLLDFMPLTAARRGGPKVVNMTHNPAEGFHLWTSGTSLLALSSAPLGPEGLSKCFSFMTTFLDNVPTELWAQAAGAPAPQPPEEPLRPS